MRLLFILIVAITPILSAAGELRVGTAAVDITPPVGTPLAGYYALRPATGVHDPLYAKAIVFEQGGAKAAVVVCDLLAVFHAVVAEARARVTAETGIAGDRVMISAMHSHTGPFLLRGSHRDTLYGGDHELTVKYHAALPLLIARAVKEADARLAPARLQVGHGRLEGVAFNRRHLMKDGSVAWNVRSLGPDYLKPAGPTDPDVPVLYVETADGKPLVTYVNFAMHLDVVGGTEMSADFPAVLAWHLAKVKRAEKLTIFSIGTAGDVNHIDRTKGGPQKGFAEAERIGGALAGAVVTTYGRLDGVATFPPRVRREVVKLPLPEVTPEELADARKVATTFGKNAPGTVAKAKAFKVLDVYARQGKPLDAEVQVIALSDDVAIVSLPGEVFAELGLSIKRDSPFKHTIIATLANGSIGYIPTRQAYVEGNYEPLSAQCASGSGEKLVEAALKLLKEVKATPSSR